MHGVDWLVALVTFLLFLATVASIWATWRLGQRQEALQRDLAAVARMQDEKQRLFEQRAQLVPIWQYISSLSDIDPLSPVTPDAVDAVNTLEFVAVCVEAGVLDRATVMRTFRKKYMHIYRQIGLCQSLPGLTGKSNPNAPMSGQELLEENPAAQRLYQQLESERLNEGVPTDL